MNAANFRGGSGGCERERVAAVGRGLRSAPVGGSQGKRDGGVASPVVAGVADPGPAPARPAAFPAETPLARARGHGGKLAPLFPFVALLLAFCAAPLRAQNGILWQGIVIDTGNSVQPPTAPAGTTVSINLTVQNNGGNDWIGGYDIQLLDAAGTPIAGVSIDGTNVGDVAQPAIALTLPTGASYPYTYTVRLVVVQQGVEYFGGIQERNITVTAPPPPPVNAATWGTGETGGLPATGNPGTQIRFNATATNTGNTTWGAGYFFDLRDANGGRVDTVAVTGAVAPGGAFTNSFLVTLPAASGPHDYTFVGWQGAWVVGADYFSESAARTITVNNLPPYAGVTLSASTFASGPASTLPFLHTDDVITTAFRLRAKVVGGSLDGYGYHMGMAWNQNPAQLTSTAPPSTTPFAPSIGSNTPRPTARSSRSARITTTRSRSRRAASWRWRYILSTSRPRRRFRPPRAWASFPTGSTRGW